MRDYFENAQRERRVHHPPPRLHTTAPPTHMTFAERQLHVEMRKSLQHRQEGHDDRVRARERIMRHMVQNDMQLEIAHIQGLQSRMNLPAHLRTRLADIQGLVE